MRPYNKVKHFDPHICRACWLHLKHALTIFNQISFSSLQRGTEAVSKGGSLWFRNVCLFATANKQTCDFGLPKSVFFRHFFVERQRNGIKCQPRARAAGTV